MFQMENQFVQSLLNYLAGRPYAEVYQMVEYIRNLKEVAEFKPSVLDVSDTNVKLVEEKVA